MKDLPFSAREASTSTGCNKVSNEPFFCPTYAEKCLHFRPYHGMLLLCDQKELLDCIPVDGSPTLSRLLNVYTPLRSFQTLAFECGVPLSQVRFCRLLKAMTACPGMRNAHMGMTDSYHFRS